MGTRSPVVPETPTDFIGIMKLLSDPEAFAERLRILETLRADALKRIEQVAPAEDIHRLQAQAATDRNMAGEELRAAKIEATRLQRTAGEILQQARDEAGRLVAAAEMTARTIRDTAKAKLAEAHALSAQGQAALEKGELLSREAKAMAAEAIRLKTDYERRLDQITRTLQGLTGVPV